MNLARSVQPAAAMIQGILSKRSIHVSTALNRVSVGRYKPTRNRSFPLTYEMAMKPHHIASRKAWNSWNTSNLKDETDRASYVLVEDAYIRSFMVGVWRALVAEVIIKRQHNMIRIVGIIKPIGGPVKFYFLIGFTEEFLSRFFHCPVKLELVTLERKNELIYQYI